MEARMKVPSFIAILILAIGLVANAGPASAQAYGTSFTTSTIYQNPELSTASRVHYIYFPSPETKNPIDIPRPDIPEGKTVSVFIGTLDQASQGFHGLTYVQSATKLVSIQMKTAQPSSPIRVRPLTNLPTYGSPTVWIPSVLRDESSANTILYIQNIDSQSDLVRLNLFDLQASLVYSSHLVLEPGETYTLDVNTLPEDQFPKKFNGSGLLIATLQDGKTPGNITANVLELDASFLGARSFEGLGHGKQQVFMPSAACNFDIGAGVLVNSAYAVQNADLNNATEVTVTYTNGITQTATLLPGAKVSLVTCTAAGMPSDFLGAATIRSNPTQIIALGKVYGAGLSTAFTGAPADSGTKDLALPYVRWVNDANWYQGTQQRTFIAIQNIGSEPVPSLQVFFYPCHGERIAYDIPLPAEGLAPGQKVSLNPGDANFDQFGTCKNGPQVGGSALIVGAVNSQLAAVVRVQQWDSQHNIVVGEDYNAISLP
jgi:hypothetical protein